MRSKTTHVNPSRRPGWLGPLRCAALVAAIIFTIEWWTMLTFSHFGLGLTARGEQWADACLLSFTTFISIYVFGVGFRRRAEAEAVRLEQRRGSIDEHGVLSFLPSPRTSAALAGMVILVVEIFVMHAIESIIEGVHQSVIDFANAVILGVLGGVLAMWIFRAQHDPWFRRERRPAFGMTASPARYIVIQQSVAIAVIGILGIVSYLVDHQGVERRMVIGEQVNIAGRQRMLSQRMSKNALLLARSSDEPEGDPREAIERDCEAWTISHRALLDGSDAIPPITDPQARAMLEELTPLVTADAAKLIQLVALSPGDPSSPARAAAIVHDLNTFVHRMDAAVERLAEATHFQAEADDETSAMLFSLLCVSIVACWVLVLLPGVELVRDQWARMDHARTRLARLALIARRTHNAVIITDTNARIEWVNEGFTRITGYELHEVKGRTPGSILQGPGTDPDVVARMREGIRTRKGFREEILNYNKSGKSYWLEVDVQPLVNERGEHTGFMAIETDITARRNAELALQRSLAELEVFVTHAPAAIALFDHAMRYIAYSRRWLDDYHLGDQNLIGRSHYEVLPEIPEKWRRVHQRALAGETCSSDEEPFTRADGSVQWLQWEVIPWRDTEGKIRGVVMKTQDITESRKVARRIAESESRLRSMFNAMAEGIVVQDTSGAIVSANRAACDILGLSMDQLLGRAPMEPQWRIRDEDGNDITNKTHPLSITLRTGEPLREFPMSIDRADGTCVDISVNSEPITDETGRITAALASFVDVTERRALERELNEQSARARIATAAAKGGVWEWRFATGEIIWDDLQREQYEIDPVHEESSFEVWRSRLHPEDAHAAIERTQAAFESHEYLNHKYRIVTPSGLTRWINTCATTLRDDDGVPIAMIGVDMDVTAQVEAGIRERELSERIKIITDGVRGVVFEIRVHAAEHFSIPFVSSEIDRRFGVDPQAVEWDATLFLARVHDEDRSALVRAFRDAATNDSELDVQVRMIDVREQPRWMHFTANRRHESDGSTTFFGVATDVTENRAAQAALAEAKQAAEAANHAKSAFLANMSHEIRTPMTAVLGYADLLLEECRSIGVSDAIGEHVATIQRNGNHLLSLINDVLDLSKIEADRMTIERIEIDPVALARDTANLLAVRAKEKAIDLCVSIAEGVPRHIVSDPVRLRQILNNIVGNAIKFTERGSVHIGIALTGDRKALQFRVTDTGIGMRDEQVRALFTPFQQADESTTRRFGGTGLGLAISGRLAELLGGDIVVESDVGKGSRFIITIDPGPIDDDAPVCAPGDYRPAVLKAGTTTRAASIAVKADGPLSTPLAGLRILLAEDGPDNQRLISFLLRNAGAVVTVAENGRRAIEAMDAAHEPFHVVLMDMQMPELDGYSATLELRARGETVPIIALTAHAMADDRARCIAAGCTEYATKPINRDVLIAMCIRHSRGGATRSQGAA
ncbi:MAG: PAS domain S-box protein [Phycisphaerales bacterium]|jgi:PAS domain S-box-containing protein|nr:PAS domain S-box protein [Phycisphaerales bacterium]